MLKPAVNNHLLTYLILLGDGLHNFIGGMSIAGTFLIGGLAAYFLSFSIDISFLIPFAAGNFIYIGATDLVPEVNKHKDFKVNLVNLVNFLAFILGILLIKVL